MAATKTDDRGSAPGKIKMNKKAWPKLKKAPVVVKKKPKAKKK